MNLFTHWTEDNMEVRPLCITLLMLLHAHSQDVAEASLTVSPNKQQFFEYESVTFHCGGVPLCEVVHEVKGKLSACEATNVRTRTGSSCSLQTVYAEDSGEYWSKTGGGWRSNSINIIVTGGPVILESPVLPVMEGEDVVLSCRNKTTTSQLTADFYKDGRHMGNSSTGNMIIHRVSASDEGFYTCETTAGRSPQSWMSVRVNESETPQDDLLLPPEQHCSLYLTLRTVLTVLMLLLQLLLLGRLHCGTTQKKKKKKKSHPHKCKCVKKNSDDK